MRAFIADTNKGADRGAVHVFDVPTGRKLRSIPSLYNPDLAVSPDGSKLCVVQTDVSASPSEHQLLLYETDKYRLVAQTPLPDRFLYNVAPTAPTLQLSHDGRYCHLSTARLRGDDEADYSVVTVDLADMKVVGAGLKTPEAIFSFGASPSAGIVYVAMSGKEMDAIGVGNPLREGAIQNAWLSEGGGVARANHKEPELPIAGVVLWGDGPVLYQVTRRGQLRACQLEKRTLSAPVQLDIPPDLFVPLQGIAASRTHLLIGLAREEFACRGQSEIVYLYEVDGGLFRKAGLCFGPLCEKLAVAPDGSLLFGLSREGRSLTFLDLPSGELRGRIDAVGKSPVALAVAAGDNKVSERGN